MTTANIFDPRPTTYYDENGQIASGAKAYFFLANTNTPMPVYTDQGLTTPHAFPVVASSRGVLPVVYFAYGNAYRVLIQSANNITIYDAPYVPNEAPPSSGGGLVVTATQIYRTGYVLISPFDDPIDGFVRMNGRTLGSLSSGATEYAGSDGHDLFVKLYTKYSDARAPVSGGRGASAEADWSANKTITLPSTRGRVLIGSDTMGNTAANISQVSTTISVTNGSTASTVASATGLARGMSLIIAGAAAGTISDISGTAVTLSTPYAGTTNASASLRASFLDDAQAVGGAGGSQTVTQAGSEVGVHKHTITDPGHTHNYRAFVAAYAAGFGNVPNSASLTDPTSSATTGITINDSTAPNPMQIMQPGMVVTIFVKL